MAAPAKLQRWLELAVQGSASDLHLISGYPPVLRLHGDLTELPEPPLAPEEAEPLFAAICPQGAFERLEAQKNVDFSFAAEVNGSTVRFRANLFQSGRQLGACFRVIPGTIPAFDWAGFPLDLADRLANLRDGLVVVTGPTGIR